MFGVSMEQRGGVVAKVLTVDDDPADLIALSAVLEPLEIEVIAAATGAEALTLAAQDEFAAILLDTLSQSYLQSPPRPEARTAPPSPIREQQTISP
jgi:response regulator RpfG family c-di-GMP phosphodiesterase